MTHDMTHTFPLLLDLILILIAAVAIAFIFNRLRQPTIVGFMLAGVLIGPSGLGLIKDPKAIETLAEIGVMLLLFTIGLEFSMRRVLEMKRLVLLGGGLQVLLTAAPVALLFYLSGRTLSQAIFFGFLFALSSTAIVLRSYVERAETDAPHGKVGIGILLFQDLSVVPMMLLIPVLAGQGGTSPFDIAVTLGTALLAIAVIVFTARTVMPFLLNHIVKLRSPEVFIIFIVLVGLGTAFLTSMFGLSLALGAFIAGLVLSESEYNHQITADILPLRDVFNSIFFVSVGMLLVLDNLVSDWPTVLALTAALIVSKAVVVLAVVGILGYSLRVSIVTALGLAQIGEFSLIVALSGLAQGLFSQTDYQRFLGAAILSMIATPFLIKAAPSIGHWVQTLFSPKRKPTTIESEQESDFKNHVIIVGYGLNGRNLAKGLRKTGLPYLVVELNSEVVRAAKAQDEQIIYGDATRREILRHAGLGQARILVLAISDPAATRHTVGFARQMNPDIHIIVRTRYVAEVPELLRLGANDVIPEEFETGVEIFSRVLRDYDLEPREIQERVAEIRRECYEILRSPYSIKAKLDTDDLVAISTETIEIGAGSAASGKTIGETMLRSRTRASIVAVMRNGHREINPSVDFRLAAGDILLLLGNPEQVALATEQLGGMHE